MATEQIKLWLEIIEEMKGKGLNVEYSKIFQEILAKDSHVKFFNQFDADIRKRELYFINNSIKGMINFINKRDNDALGLILFGHEALCRCPLTADKKTLTSIIKKLALGFPDPNGTALFEGLLASINQLKKSKAKSKIIILLTDGQPNRINIHPAVVIKAAQQLNIKIYTIGIGNVGETLHEEGGQLYIDPGLNPELLKEIAKNTGGKFFLASKPQEMKNIYNTIDKLEKTELDVPIFTNYHDYFIPFLWIIILLFSIEIITSSLVWFSI